MYGRYLNVEDQLLSHPNIALRFMGRFSAATTLRGDSHSTWKMRDTGHSLYRVWSCHWDTPPQYHGWVYHQLVSGNFDALYQLGPGKRVNWGELYVALYSAPQDGVGFFVMTTRTGKSLNVDTGWRPVELRGERFYSTIARFHY